MLNGLLFVMCDQQSVEMVFQRLYDTLVQTAFYDGVHIQKLMLLKLKSSTKVKTDDFLNFDFGVAP